MNFLYKRILYFIGFGSFTLTGCFSAKYGMPTDYESYKAIKVITEKNEPIEGLSVTVFEETDTLYHTTTNNGGIAGFDVGFYTDFNYYAEIIDVDGNENLGSFTSKKVLLDQPDTTIVVMK